MRNPKKNRLARAASWTMLGLGAVALFASFIYTSSILAFIGLGLAFWGATLLYIRPGEYSRKVVLDASILPLLVTLDQTLGELGYKGKAVYLPPKYFENPETTKIYIAKQEQAGLPSPEHILEYENKLFLKNPQGILLTPPGTELTRLFEKTLETSFTKVDLKYLQENLPKLLIEDLEIADNMEIEPSSDKVAKEITESISLLQENSDTIHVRISNSIYNEICKETSKLPNIQGKIGCPLCSAIACALTKASGKPIIIENVQPSEDGKTIDARYGILTITEPQEQVSEASAESVKNVGLRHNRLMNLAGAFSILSGSTILAWISWLTWYDMTTFGKDIIAIFFGSRTGEAISLGIGMKVIYYFLIGLALVVSGLVTLGARRALEKKRLKTVEQAPVDHRGGKMP
jgi:hypothetical protein